MLTRIKTLAYNKYKRQTIGTHIMVFTSVSLLAVVLSLGVLYIWHEYELRMKESSQALDREMQGQIRRINEWVSEKSSRVEAVALLQSVRGNNREDMLLDFRASLKGDMDFGGFAFVDRSGKTTVDTLAAPGIDVSDRQYFQSGMAGRPFVTEIITGKATGRQVMLFSSPVFTRENEVGGIVLATVSIQALSNVIQEIQLGKTGKAYLIDDTGKILAQSGANDAGDRDMTGNEGYRRAREGQYSVASYTNHQGTVVMGAYRHLPEQK